MDDATKGLLEALEPFDLTIHHWSRLLASVPPGRPSSVLNMSLRVYLSDRISELRHDAFSTTPGIREAEDRLDSLTKEYAAFLALRYAACLAESGPYSYCPAAWDRALSAISRIEAERA